MHARLRLYLAVAILSGVFAIHITGRSLVGFGIGTLIDNARTTRYRTDSARKFIAVAPATPVVLHLRGGRALSGRYRGWRDLPDSVYAPRYESWRSALPADAARLVPGAGPPSARAGTALRATPRRTAAREYTTAACAD